MAANTASPRLSQNTFPIFLNPIICDENTTNFASYLNGTSQYYMYVMSICSLASISMQIKPCVTSTFRIILCSVVSILLTHQCLVGSIVNNHLLLKNISSSWWVTLSRNYVYEQRAKCFLPADVRNTTLWKYDKCNFPPHVYNRM